MIFNSYTFWVFFAVVYLLYRVLPHRGQNVMLLTAGYIFYGYWDWRFLSLLLFSTLIDYFVAIRISETSSQRLRRLFITVSICTQLGILGFFKYYGFFATELNNLLGVLGIPTSLPVLNVILPVGVSFYTFQTLSYTLDVYRGDCRYTRDFIDFALFVTFFPQLIAGPIERASRFLPQVINPRVHQPGDFSEGLYHIITGLFKKVFIADNMAPIANTIFNSDTSQLSGGECLVGIYAFAFQIYGDFSGYSSIAQGLAKWLGFDLMYNFKLPYFAISPSDFWRRWHISLSTWFRDYVYISLGGNRGGMWITYRNLMLTNLLSGIWHGANWTFIAWGGYHGLLLCVYRLFQGWRDRFYKEPGEPGAPPRLPRLQRVIRIVVMFHLVCLGWLMFRAESMSQVWGMLFRISTDFHTAPFAISALAMMAFYVGPLFIYEAWVEKKRDLLALTRVHWLVRGLVYSYCAIMLVFFPPPVSNVFIYFQF